MSDKMSNAEQPLSYEDKLHKYMSQRGKHQSVYQGTHSREKDIAPVKRPQSTYTSFTPDNNLVIPTKPTVIPTTPDSRNIQLSSPRVNEGKLSRILRIIRG